MDFEWIPHPQNDDTIILIHGWACLPTDFNLQIDHFKKTHSLLLPHYSNLNTHTIPPDSNALEWIAKQIQPAIRQHHIQQATLVGHSMGGSIALCLSELSPCVFTDVVLLDASVIMTDAKRKAFTELGKKILTDDGTITLSAFIDSYMINNTHDNANIMKEKKAEILSAYKQSPQLLSRLITDAANLQCQPILKQLANAHYIAACHPLVEINELHAINANIKYHHLKQCGHFVMLNAANEVNRIIDNVRQ